MKITDFNIDIENDNVCLKGPFIFVDNNCDNTQYLTNYNLGNILSLIKNKITLEDWNNLVDQIKRM